MRLEFIRKLFKPTKYKRLLFFLFMDIAIIISGFYLSFYFRFGFVFPKEYNKIFLPWSLGLVFITVLLLFIFNMYNVNWRFVGIIELKNLIKVLLITGIVFYSINLIAQSYFQKQSLPKGVVIITLILNFSLIAILRISKRLYYVFFRSMEGNQTMIIGMDYSGERLIKELINEHDEVLIPKVIIDSDEMKDKTKIHGIPVISGYNKIKFYIEKFRIKTVLLNLNHTSKREVKKIFETVKSTGLKDIRIVPTVKNYDSNVYKIKNFKKLSISDLLFREPVSIEYSKIEEFFNNKIVLVTGAAGSIGSEIVRQLLKFNVNKIVAFEIDETEIFEFNYELKSNALDTKVNFVLGDIRDLNKIELVFEEFKPDIVFHASAYKHVPILEDFPEEGIKTNVLGTYNLVKCSEKYNVDKFINISTDKAVNPSSIMGATKRIAEMIGSAYNSNKTKVISVRFGNVLGSRGSVIPLFLKQIERGGPITLTHKDMKRYFMSIPEAVLLVFQAAYMGQGGEVFVLDMGNPVQIFDLAHSLIMLNNMELGKDINIVYTGLRPGEKMFEELLTAEEGTEKTSHSKIFIAKGKNNISKIEIKERIEKIVDNLKNKEETVENIKKLVPSNVFKK